MLCKDGQSLDRDATYASLLKLERLFDIIQPMTVRNRDTEAREAAVSRAVVAWVDLVREIRASKEAHLSPKAQREATRRAVDNVLADVLKHMADEEYAKETIRATERVLMKAMDIAFPS